jgi:hypothetical protein
MLIEMVGINDLRRHPKNARRGDVSRIVESIKANGFFNPLIVQKSTGFILAGNHRHQAAEQLGIDLLPVVYIECDDRQARRIMLADNKTSDRGSYDKDSLAKLLQETLGDGGLLGTAFDAAEVDKLLQETAAGPAPTVDQFDLLPYERTFFLVAGPLTAHNAIATALNKLVLDNPEVDYEHAQDSPKDSAILPRVESQGGELAPGREGLASISDALQTWKTAGHGT